MTASFSARVAQRGLAVLLCGGLWLTAAQPASSQVGHVDITPIGPSAFACAVPELGSDDCPRLAAPVPLSELETGWEATAANGVLDHSIDPSTSHAPPSLDWTDLFRWASPIQRDRLGFTLRTMQMSDGSIVVTREVLNGSEPASLGFALPVEKSPLSFDVSGVLRSDDTDGLTWVLRDETEREEFVNAVVKQAEALRRIAERSDGLFDAVSDLTASGRFIQQFVEGRADATISASNRGASFGVGAGVLYGIVAQGDLTFGFTGAVTFVCSKDGSRDLSLGIGGEFGGSGDFLQLPELLSARYLRWANEVGRGPDAIERAREELAEFLDAHRKNLSGGATLTVDGSVTLHGRSTSSCRAPGSPPAAAGSHAMAIEGATVTLSLRSDSGLVQVDDRFRTMAGAAAPDLIEAASSNHLVKGATRLAGLALVPTGRSRGNNLVVEERIELHTGQLGTLVDLADARPGAVGLAAGVLATTTRARLLLLEGTSTTTDDHITFRVGPLVAGYDLSTRSDHLALVGAFDLTVTADAEPIPTIDVRPPPTSPPAAVPVPTLPPAAPGAGAPATACDLGGVPADCDLVQAARFVYDREVNESCDGPGAREFITTYVDPTALQQYSVEDFIAECQKMNDEAGGPRVCNWPDQVRAIDANHVEIEYDCTSPAGSWTLLHGWRRRAPGGPWTVLGQVLARPGDECNALWC